MKGLGHIFVAQRVLGEKVLAAQGVLLPEMVPYLAEDVFDWQELHEGGEKLYQYLQKTAPQEIDLALGLLTHGVTFGADGLNTRHWRGGTGYAHQKEALLKSWKQREYALFMEMGTGKSKVLIDNMAILYGKGAIDGTLIVAPKGVYRNWSEREIPMRSTLLRCNAVASAWLTYVSSPSSLIIMMRSLAVSRS